MFLTTEMHCEWVPRPSLRPVTEDLDLSQPFACAGALNGESKDPTFSSHLFPLTPFTGVPEHAYLRTGTMLAIMQLAFSVQFVV
jgi:hypothetical protein